MGLLSSRQEFFKLGTGDLDVNCYESQDNENFHLLNRIGAIRLLDAISCIYTNNFLCHNWKTIKSNLFNLKDNSFRIDDRRDESHDYMINRKIEGNNRLSSQQISYTHLKNTNYPRSRHGYDVGPTRPDYVNTRYRYSKVTNRDENYPRYAFSEGNSYGCYNCGEFNHRQANCRFDHKIKCNVCYEYGHKSRLCKQNIHY